MTNTTLKKISEVLGISISTVSRALKNHPDISDKTKKKVVELANTLDYEPNANAIHLRTQKNNLFRVIVPSISNFFYDSFIASIEEECRKNNYSLIILQSGDNPETEINNIRLCRQNRVTGVFACLTLQTTNVDPYIKLKEQDIPVIFFDKVPEIKDCNKVCVADAISASMAATRIISNAPKKVLAIFGSMSLSITRKRLDAFLEVFREKSPGTQLMIEHASNPEEAELITQKKIKNKFDCLFCMSDEVLTGAMKAVQKKQLNIPNDIKVIAISNGFIPKLYYPEITYVETSGHKLGKLAFSSMMACIGGSTFIQELTTESILVEGGTM